MFGESLSSEETREELRHFDQLTIEKRKGTIFAGFHEGEFWKFKCSYKYKLGEVDRYKYVYFTTLVLHLITNPSYKRDPAWTDRILFATHADLHEEPDKSCVDILLYTTIPSYTTSDHVSDSLSLY